MVIDKSILIAKITGCHAIHGAVTLTSYASSPEALSEFKIFHDKDKVIFNLNKLNITPKNIIATFENIKDRTTAETLKGTNLYIYRSQLDDNLQEDEFYYSDLIGLDVFAEKEKAPIATVKALHDFGAGTILELQLPSNKTILIPFSKSTVPTVNIKSGFICINLENIEIDLDKNNTANDKNQIRNN
ncbi:ribosome maturation factor RimM [Bartonella sp. DGB1]|uniref:ribosome maturation factor RimM n=1 Tax=Bartonella sp. DGB1 TaxID=3239807 RepID=UPI003523228E